MPGNLAGHLEHDELVGPGRKAAEATELVDPGEDVHQGVVGRLMCEVVELGAADPPQPAASSRQLVVGNPEQQAVQLGGRPLVLRMVGGPESLDPSPGVGVGGAPIPPRFHAGIIALVPLLVSPGSVSLSAGFPESCLHATRGVDRDPNPSARIQLLTGRVKAGLGPTRWAAC